MSEVIQKENRYFYMGIAIILVVFHHYYRGGMLLWDYTNRFLCQFENGNIGVDVFMFLSAYGCCASIEKNKLGTYFKNRIIHIYPLYLLFLILLVLIFRHLSILSTLKTIVMCMTGAAIIHSADVYVDWYTPSLIAMYIFLPLLLYIIKKWRNRCSKLKCNETWTWVKPTVGYLFLLLIVILTKKLISMNLIYLAFVWRFPIIACGMYAYFHRFETEKLLVIFSILACSPIFIGIDNVMQHSLLIPPVLISLSYISVTKYKVCSWFASIVGKNTFAIYLAQELFVKKDTMPLLKCDNIAYSYLAITILIIVVSICFVYMQKLFEKIIVKLVKTTN